jgi:hypothetical protein
MFICWGQQLHQPILALVRSYNMENIKIIISELDQSEHVIIDRGNGEFTSMPKSVWDEQQAQQQKLLGEIHE